MNKKRYALTIIFTVFLQSAIFARIHIYEATPNLYIAFVSAIAILYGPGWGGYTGLGLGLLEDLMYSEVLGVSALLYFLIGTAIGKALQNNEGRTVTGVLMTVLATLFSVASLTLYRRILRIAISPMRTLLIAAGLSMVMNAVLFLLLIWILRMYLKPRSVRRFSGFF